MNRYIPVHVNGRIYMETAVDGKATGTRASFSEVCEQANAAAELAEALRAAVAYDDRSGARYLDGKQTPARPPWYAQAVAALTKVA